jgi:hypothetical protein
MSDIHCYSGYPAYPGDSYQLIARIFTAYIVIRKEKKRKEKKRKEKKRKELGSRRTTRETEGLGTCHPQERGNRVSETSEINSPAVTIITHKSMRATIQTWECHAHEVQFD